MAAFWSDGDAYVLDGAELVVLVALNDALRAQHLPVLLAVNLQVFVVEGARGPTLLHLSGAAIDNSNYPTQ